MPGLQPKSRVDPISVIHKIIDDVPISWQRQIAGVYLQPDWAALIDHDIAWALEGTPAVGGFLQITVDCPAGTTWYITSFCIAATAQAAADRNNNQFALGSLINNSTGVTYTQIAGNGGFFQNFVQPAIVLAGEQLQILGENYANHEQRMRVSARGYWL